MSQMELTREIERFLQLIGSQHPGFDISPTAPAIFKISPQKLTSKIRLGVLALTHGNETLGLPILNQLLEQIFAGQMELNFTLYVGLGNLPAALKNVRYLQSDLNRSFGKKTQQTAEEKRALEIQLGMLDQCDLLLDLHQTIQPTKSPFFIFQYHSQRCFQLLNHLNPGVPVVVQSEAIGDSSSLSTDEYLRSRGGFGVALELGQIGHHQKDFDFGFMVCRKFLLALSAFSSIAEMLSTEPHRRGVYPQFLLGPKILAEEEGVELLPGLENFSPLMKGQAYAKVKTAADEKILISPCDGLVMFPKYSKPVLPGQELFYLCQIKDEGLAQQLAVAPQIISL